MKQFLMYALILLVNVAVAQQAPQWQGKFEQLDQTLPTPNEYRTGSGAPGVKPRPATPVPQKPPADAKSARPAPNFARP